MQTAIRTDSIARKTMRERKNDEGDNPRGNFQLQDSYRKEIADTEKSQDMHIAQTRL